MYRIYLIALSFVLFCFSCSNQELTSESSQLSVSLDNFESTLRPPEIIPNNEFTSFILLKQYEDWNDLLIYQNEELPRQVDSAYYGNLELLVLSQLVLDSDFMEEASNELKNKCLDRVSSRKIPLDLNVHHALIMDASKRLSKEEVRNLVELYFTQYQSFYNTPEFRRAYEQKFPTQFVELKSLL